MNWNSHEFIWLDWTILAVGIVAVIWAVWRSVQKRQTLATRSKRSVRLSYLAKVSMVHHWCCYLCSQYRFGTSGRFGRNRCQIRSRYAHWEMQGWMILLLGWLFVPFYQLIKQ